MNNMDYSMLAMFFDKMSRKHDARKILIRAKLLIYEYIRAHLDGHIINSNEAQNAALEGIHGTGSTAAQC